MIRFILLISLVILTSCFKQDNKPRDCEELSMKFYRGLPKPSAAYKKYCKDQEANLKYPPSKCQKALGVLMMTGSSKQVKKDFGPRIMECFNQGDLDRFLKEENN